MKIMTFGVNKDSQLYKGLVKHNLDCIRLELVFPDEFPMAPPLARIVHPKLTGGYVRKIIQELFEIDSREKKILL
jgi:hypothetical protein